MAEDPKEEAEEGALAAAFEAWKGARADSGAAGLVLVEADEEGGRLVMAVGGVRAEMHCPREEGAVFMLDADAPELSEWAARLSSFALDKAGAVSLDGMLDEAARQYGKLFGGCGQEEEGADAGEDEEEFDAEGWGVGDDDDDDGGDGGDGGGWGDFEEADATGLMVEDRAFNERRERRKRWAAKEAELRERLVRVDAKKMKEQIFSSAESSRILTNALERLVQEGRERYGVEAEAVDDSIFHWRVRLHDPAPDSRLHDDLMRLKVRHGYAYVELELKFLLDIFPFYPPAVRLVRPRLQGFLAHRVMSMHEVQLANWTPVREIHDVIGMVRTLLEREGRVDIGYPANSLDSPQPPYTAAEDLLHRLSSLSGIGPRIESIARAGELAREEEAARARREAKAAKTKEAQQQQQQSSSSSSSSATSVIAAAASAVASRVAGGGGGGGKKRTYWAAGTGYGTGGAGSSSDWDPRAWKAAQAEKDNETVEVCCELLTELTRKDQSVWKPVCVSCLVPFLRGFLQNDSITDMEEHADLNQAALRILCELVRSPETSPVVLCRLRNETKSLADDLVALASQARLIMRMEAQTAAAAPDAGAAAAAAAPAAATAEQAHASMAALICTAADLVAEAEKVLKARPELAAAVADFEANMTREDVAAEDGDGARPAGAGAGASSSTAERKEEDEESLEARYVRLMSDERFAEVAAFSAHHYRGNAAAQNGAPARRFVKRLATEYADLTRSLPLSADSSVFLRVQEGNVALAQCMIVAPDETPYGRGCFLFDVYFPPAYPDKPPLVNLRTTGGGTVRFNPNLYNCGKVCLSLLGTWQGQVGESWTQASTFLQVAVSIQSLIFVPHPYFNEPGYEAIMGTPRGDSSSNQYNSPRRQQTVRFAMIDMLRRPPAGFERVVRTHFRLQRDNILAQIDGWLGDGTMADNDKQVLVKYRADLVAEMDKLGSG